MKPINEYLLSKKHTKTNSGFFDINEYDVRTKQDVIDFFEKKNFKRIDTEVLQQFYAEFEKLNQPVYWLGNFSTDNVASKWVRFGKGGHISESNPVMFWRLNNKAPQLTTYCYTTSKDIGDEIIIKSFDEFKNFVNKIFDK